MSKLLDSAHHKAISAKLISMQPAQQMDSLKSATDDLSAFLDDTNWFKIVMNLGKLLTIVRLIVSQIKELFR